MPTLIACLDATVRRFGGVPTYALTDNPRTVSIDHVAGIPVRHPQIVETARHYGMAVHTCVPFDPESKGGSEATVKIAKADLVPTEANLLPEYAAFTDLEAACDRFCATVNARRHRESARIPAEALADERPRLHTLPATPHTLALGTTRSVGTDQTIRFGSVRYSTPPGLVGAEVWVRAAGADLVVVADLDALPRVPDWATGRRGLSEVARHRLSTPGNPSIDPAHYPNHPQDPDGAPRPPRPRARSAAEARFLDLGPGAHTWLIAASAAGVVRIRAKMTAAVELAAFVGADTVSAALAVAAEAARFAESDLPAIAQAPHRHRRRTGRRRRGAFGPARHRRLGRLRHRPHGGPLVNPTAPPLPDDLLAVLKRMRLPYLRAAAPEVLATAKAQRWDPTEVLKVLLTEEVRGRDEATRAMRRKAAGLPAGKTFSSWREEDSSIPAPTQSALAALEWVHRAENLAISGPSGTGKTHFVEALAHAVIDAGMRVSWFTLESLTTAIGRAAVDGSITKTITRITRAELIVVDDIGMLPSGQAAAEAFYRLVDAAYERRSVAVTSNLHPSGFDTIMPKTLATAAVDRLLHHAHVVITEGTSLRLSEATAGRGVVPLT